MLMYVCVEGATTDDGFLPRSHRFFSSRVIPLGAFSHVSAGKQMKFMFLGLIKSIQRRKVYFDK